MNKTFIMNKILDYLHKTVEYFLHLLLATDNECYILFSVTHYLAQQIDVYLYVGLYILRLA